METTEVIHLQYFFFTFIIYILKKAPSLVHTHNYTFVCQGTLMIKKKIYPQMNL